MPGKTLCKKGCYTLCITLISSVKHMYNDAYMETLYAILRILFTVSYNNPFYTVKQPTDYKTSYSQC